MVFHDFPWRFWMIVKEVGRRFRGFDLPLDQCGYIPGDLSCHFILYLQGCITIQSDSPWQPLFRRLKHEAAGEAFQIHLFRSQFSTWSWKDLNQADPFRQAVICFSEGIIIIIIITIIIIIIIVIIITTWDSPFKKQQNTHSYTYNIFIRFYLDIEHNPPFPCQQHRELPLVWSTFPCKRRRHKSCNVNWMPWSPASKPQLLGAMLVETRRNKGKQKRKRSYCRYLSIVVSKSR